ncbi:hypothetical protein F4777DRAFT_137274 [Nemania sp. FL0916]|nr:hypothetical protein F4777DRAFT_137274 [Nemania sp. FL0916]
MSSQSEQDVLKSRLDQAARDARQPTSSQTATNPNLIEKAASKLLGVGLSQEQQDKTSPKDLAGPPNRPEHDDHIAEFVREQHRSKNPGGDIEG